jgi:serine hydrolase
MAQQILIINGGNTYLSYEDYISKMKSIDIKIEKLRPSKDWRDSLEDELGENYEVYIPKMPNTTNARYEEWKIWFEKIINKLNDNLIIIGHSLGGIFLAKYLNKNNSPKKIKATILLAAPYDDKDLNEPLAEFNLNSSLNNFARQAGKVYLIQSKDDPVVPISELEKYKKALPNVETLIVDGMGHFKVEKFPELVVLIKKI